MRSTYKFGVIMFAGALWNYVVASVSAFVSEVVITNARAVVSNAGHLIDGDAQEEILYDISGMPAIAFKKLEQQLESQLALTLPPGQKVSTRLVKQSLKLITETVTGLATGEKSHICVLFGGKDNMANMITINVSELIENRENTLLYLYTRMYDSGFDSSKKLAIAFHSRRDAELTMELFSQNQVSMDDYSKDARLGLGWEDLAGPISDERLRGNLDLLSAVAPNGLAVQQGLNPQQIRDVFVTMDAIFRAPEVLFPANQLKKESSAFVVQANAYIGQASSGIYGITPDPTRAVALLGIPSGIVDSSSVSGSSPSGSSTSSSSTSSSSTSSSSTSSSSTSSSSTSSSSTSSSSTSSSSTSSSSTSSSKTSMLRAQLAEFERDFKGLLEELDEFNKKIREKTTPNQPGYDKNYKQLRKASHMLRHRLTNDSEDFFNKPSLSAYTKFVNTTTTAVNTAMKEFEKHRGFWHQIHPILKGILGILSVLLFILPAVIIHFATPGGFKGTFFETPKTHSAEYLEVLRGKITASLEEVDKKVDKNLLSSFDESDAVSSARL